MARMTSLHLTGLLRTSLNSAGNTLSSMVSGSDFGEVFDTAAVVSYKSDEAAHQLWAFQVSLICNFSHLLLCSETPSPLTMNPRNGASGLLI